VGLALPLLDSLGFAMITDDHLDASTERLGRAPHDREDQTLGAKILAAGGNVRGGALQQPSQVMLD